ncbi:MAG: PilZ domain-containing protein [Bdellovibrionaceae bacterium]|nr:PilZ domain-containing protein [Pseudobdellovibrionaceae bacterium]|tara:strand:+ start:208 stop:594 length:387 start_codon:yes stop_codon:yes gene_type:complete
MSNNQERIPRKNPAPRLNLQLDVAFRKNYARRHDIGKLKNISLTGAFLETDDVSLLNVNEKLNVKFTVSGREREIIARVIWKGHHGCGVQFQPFNNRDIQIVDDLMYFVASKKETRKKVLDSIFDKVS